MKSFSFVFIFFATFLCAAAANKPNLIIIMVDDMGYAGVSCFGNPYFKTPEIDQLAAEGMRFTDFHSSGTVCSPTRAGLLTGRYQQRAGIEAVIHPDSGHPEHRKGLRKSEFTFAEALREAGYATGLIGKWHQGYPHNTEEFHPQNHGFDEFIGYHSGNIDFVSHVGDHVKHDWWHGREETHEDGYSTHLINKYALDFVKRRAPGDKPFCLYIAHEAIHNPVQVPGDPVRRSEEEGWIRWKAPNEEARLEKYEGMTMPIDEGVGQIRRALVEAGIDKNTFVLFFSDNGPSSDFPSGSPNLRAGKGSVYEGGHRVPAIAWWPGRIAAGSETDVPAISIDVMPTILSLAGAELPVKRPLDGVDLSPVLFRKEPLVARPLFWASLGNNGSRAEAMRHGDWKLVVTHPKARPGTFENEKVELFNLASDLGESSDLAAAHTERTAEMLEALKDWYAGTQKTATPQPGGWLEAAAKAKKPVAEPVAAAAPVKNSRPVNPSLERVKDVAGLPRVLLIGDSISMGYTIPVRNLLSGKANVHRIPMNGGPTSRGVENIGSWLGDGKWDVIHFNWGIHDLKHMEDGKRQVEPADYEENLRVLVAKMKATGAALVWAATTPIPGGKLNPGRVFGDENEYNAIAKRVMEENGIAINDLHAHVKPEFERLQRPNDLHYLPEGSKFLAEKVAKEIEAALAKGPNP